MELQRVRRPEGPQDWVAQRAVITDLYVTKGLELEDLMKTMEDEQFFKATKKQYKTHFTKWDLRKNVRSSEYSAMIRKRKEREEEGKDSAFRLRGALVDDSKIVRYEKRTRTGDEHEIAEAGTPGDPSCFTPSPFASSSNAPSPDLRHCQSPNLLSISIVPVYEHTFLVRCPRLLSPGSPVYEVDYSGCRLHEVRLDYSELVREVGGRSPDDFTVTLDVDVGLKHPAFGDMSGITIFERMLQPGSDLRNILSNIEKSLLTRMRCLPTYAHKLEVVGSSIGLSALVDILFSLKPYDSFTVPSIHFGTQISTRKPVPLPIYESGSARKKMRVNLSCSNTLELERNHNLGGHRRGSCETIESTGSFRTDSVVDWGELVYGHNQ